MAKKLTLFFHELPLKVFLALWTEIVKRVFFCLVIHSSSCLFIWFLFCCFDLGEVGISFTSHAHMLLSRSDNVINNTCHRSHYCCPFRWTKWRHAQVAKNFVSFPYKFVVVCMNAPVNFSFASLIKVIIIWLLLYFFLFCWG